MNVAVTLEHRFARTPDGAVWTQAAFAYPFWTRYLTTFDAVRVVARIGEVATIPLDWKRADGERTEFVAVPDYLGPQQYLSRWPQIHRIVQRAIQASDAVIFRVPSQIAAGVASSLRQQQRPYAVEVVGDPYDVFAPGAVRHPLRPFFRAWFSRQLRQQCQTACAVAYVTQEVLQRRYPHAPRMFTTHYSNVELPLSAFVPVPREVRQVPQSVRLLLVGSLAQMYKAPDVLIDAIHTCVDGGLDLTLTIVGEGKYRADLEAQVQRLRLSERVHFLGQLSAGAAVQTQLDQADLFVLPSRTEGLPRAMIEAMARGVPCVGSTVGGIPELLSDDDLVTPGDVAALANKIREVVTDPARMTAMSARNIAKAKEYSEDVLRDRRTAFYQAIHEKTAAWLARRYAK